MWNGDMRTIPENCKKLIAQILFDSVDCKVKPRADCDWETAGKLFANHQYLINIAVGKLGQCEWFTFRANFSMQTTEVDSGAFHQLCGQVFWENIRRCARELPRDKYGAARGFG